MALATKKFKLKSQIVYGDENAEIWLLDICFFVAGEFLK